LGCIYLSTYCYQSVIWNTVTKLSVVDPSYWFLQLGSLIFANLCQFSAINFGLFLENQCCDKL
jgi:hypothetical protein